MGKYPSVSGRGIELTNVFLLDAEYSHPYEEGPLLPLDGWLHTLIMPWNESTTTTKTGINKNQNYPTART